MTFVDAVREIDRCEVCGCRDLRSVLDLGQHPLCDDLIPVGEARTCPEYPIEILFCDTCRTAHQRFQVPKRELFPSTYHYRSRFTADVLAGMQALVETCKAKFGSLAGKRVIDVGCNDGSLLDFFRNEGAVTIGIEPTGAAADAEKKGHATLQNFLSIEVAQEIIGRFGKADIITFTNVFAHIENLTEVIDSLKMLIGPETVLVVENHYLGAVLDRNQFDTFYHEHPRTYSYRSFVHIADSLSMSLNDVEFPSRYGGNIRVFIRSGDVAAAPVLADVDRAEEEFGRRIAELGDNMNRWRDLKGRELRALADQYGPLRAKAFPGRAAILVKLLDLDENIVKAVYEKPGSMKIGHYLPGTRIPILSDDDLFALPPSPAPLVNLAWHISKEIREYLAEQGYAGPVIDILSQQDFDPQDAKA